MDYEIDKIRASIKNKKHIKKETKNPNYLYFINKFLVVVLLTIITLIGLKSSTSFKTVFYKQIYEKNISFATINNLYQKYFGSPIPFGDILKNKTEATFNETLTFTSKSKYQDGVELVVGPNYLVPALDSGIVIFKGEKEGYGNTIIIEQANGIEVWYSNVTSNINIYDYIEKGTLVGEANEKLYLVFKKDGEVLNYEDYI